MNELTLTYDEWLATAIAKETYHYAIPMPSGATLQCEGEKVVGRVEPAPLFRIGGVYRDASGRITRVDSPCMTLNALGGNSGRWLADGGRDLMTGEDAACYEGEHAPNGRRLIPGELHEVDGQWVAMSDDRVMIPLPVKTLADLFRKPQYITTPADPSAQRDAQHKPLPVQGRSPFDPFKDCDFTVTRGNNDRIGFAGKSAHPLQRFTSADCK